MKLSLWVNVVMIPINLTSYYITGDNFCLGILTLNVVCVLLYSTHKADASGTESKEEPKL